MKKKGLKKTSEKTIKNSFKDTIKNKWLMFLVLFLSLVFLLLASILPYFQTKIGFVKFFSPDENANYVFTKLYQESGQLFIFEKYNMIASEVIHPRSYFSQDSNLKPLSFLGIIIIYGNLAKILGPAVIPFLTPFFAALGLLFFYLLIEMMAGKRIALFSFLLLFSFPVFLYYSARSMFHNVLFLSLLIMGLYFLLRLFQFSVPKSKLFENKKKYYQQILSVDLPYSALSGSFLGLAIGVRTSEIIWLVPAGVLLLIFKAKKVNFLRLATFVIFVLIALFPVLYNNQVLYNSPFYGGYREMNQSIENIGQAGSGFWKSIFSGYFGDLGNYIKTIFNTVFYFGFYPLQSLKMFFHYCVEMFWYLFFPACLGAVCLLTNKRKILKQIWPYAVSWLLLSFILIFYYGSWKFVDNPDPSRFTIGNSYTRYWLPIYAGIIFLTAVFIDSVLDFINKIGNKKISNLLKVLWLAFSLLGISYLSLNFVYQGSEEGLKHYERKALVAQIEVRQVSALTEASSVIITEYHDKFLFPERKVIVGRFDDDNMNRAYKALLGKTPVYYYNFTLPESHLDYLNNRRLKDFGLQIKLHKEINSTFSLYKLYPYDL